MIYAYVLVIVASFGQGVAIDHIQFKTLAGCEAAAKEIREASRKSWSYQLSANCLNRDE